MSNFMMKLGSSLINVGKNNAYGKQIGKTNRLGQECRMKIEKLGKNELKKTFNMIDKDGNVVQQKVVIEQPTYKYGFTKRGENTISQFEKSFEHPGKTQNTFDKTIRNVYTKYNKLGQITYHHDISMYPGQKTNELILNGIKNKKEFITEYIINAEI